jgi:DNA mismatch repair protein MutS2
MIENTIREIRAGASGDQVKAMRQAIEEAREGLAPVEKPDDTEEPAFSKGDTVRLKGGTQIGELEFDPDEKGNVVIQFGAIRMRSTIEEIEAVSRRERRAEHVARNAVLNAEAAETRIDLRGKYADEAVVELEHALTAAMNAHIDRLEVIHGKGTGALRKRVHEYLASHPGISEYRLGALTEGGAGVTIIELK